MLSMEMELLGETGIKIMDESGMDGGVSGKTRKVKASDNAREPDTGTEKIHGKVEKVSGKITDEPLS